MKAQKSLEGKWISIKKALWYYSIQKQWRYERFFIKKKMIIPLAFSLAMGTFMILVLFIENRKRGNNQSLLTKKPNWIRILLMFNNLI